MVLTPRKFNQTPGAMTRSGEKVIFIGNLSIQILKNKVEEEVTHSGLISFCRNPVTHQRTGDPRANPRTNGRQFNYFSLKSFF